MTWEQLIKLEPGLLALYKRALAIRRGKHRFDPLNLWIGARGGMKSEMTALVGWSREDSAELRTQEAYDLAYGKIFYEALLGEEPETQ